MRTTNKKIIIESILILALILLLSTIAYARPVTDIFSGGLLQINDFFEGGYAPYTKAIDFFFFSLLFISIYMMGVRYAFKEVKRPEQTIAILLGLMTAFLLVLGDFSATILLPYIHWLLYLLLFMLLWWLLKGIKSKFWRFLLALLLTLLIIALLQGMYDYLRAPEIPRVRAPGMPDVRGIGGGIGGFFRDLFGSFGGIEMPGVTAPGMPDWAKDMFEKPVAPPTGPEGLPQVTTPTPTPTPPTEEKGFFGRNWWWLILFIILGILLWRYWDKIMGRVKGLRGEKPPEGEKEEEEKEAGELIKEQITNKIGDIITKKIDSKRRLREINIKKNELIKQGDTKTGYIAKLNDILKTRRGGKELANLFLEESRTLEKLKEGNVKEVIKKEREFLQELKKLSVTEETLYKSLSGWETTILQNIAEDKKTDVRKMVYNLKILIDQNIHERAEDNQKGILWLIAFCYNVEKKEDILLKKLEELFEKKHIVELVRGKFEEDITDEILLEDYNSKENEIIKLLLARILLQIKYLEILRRLLSMTPPPEPTKMEELSVKYIDAAGNQTILTKDEAENPANTMPFGTELTISTKLASGMDGEYRVVCRIDRELVKGDDGKLKIMKVEKTPADQHPTIEWDLKDFELLERQHVIAFYIANTIKSLYLLPREHRDLKWIILHIGPILRRIVITQPENNAEIPLGEEITLKAEIRNLTIPPEGYYYDWVIWNQLTREIEKTFPREITTSNEVSGTLSTSEIGLGEHFIGFVLRNVFPNAAEEQRKHLHAMPPVKINIIPKEELPEETPTSTSTTEETPEEGDLERGIEELGDILEHAPEFPPYEKLE